ncbi:hypothetical protein CCACVL1_03356 [Corchorus capsularis]|uniref:Uncharacterized protein n=1 Tax=Corchorus capsularis TaxID=210143 RepID=A0A1R3JZW6_COCAP|nr:hypothetical protein CCACVL1_03356 [Corchorus capsularis]
MAFNQITITLTNFFGLAFGTLILIMSS